MSNRFLRQTMGRDPFIPFGQSLAGLMDKAMSDVARQGDNLMRVMCDIRLRLRADTELTIDKYDITPVAYPDNSLHAKLTDPHTGKSYTVIMYEDDK